MLNILPRLAVSNGLIIAQLKWNFKYRGHVCFKPIRHICHIWN